MTAYMRIAMVIAAAATLFGCATTADNTKPKPTVAAATATDPSCLTDTGSRISGTAKCRGYGRAYSNQDIERTGQTSAADALALLDPSVTVHR
jgi:Tfp pilus assembly protein FimV